MIVGDMERKHNINLLLLSVLLLVTAACSTTKNLPEDETLYVGVKNMEILNEDKTPAGVQTLEEVEAALSYPPIMPFWEATPCVSPFPSVCGYTMTL